MADYDDTNRGVLFRNDRKESDRHPDFKGNITVKCLHCGELSKLDLASWTKESQKSGEKFQSLSASEPRPRDEGNGGY